MDRTKIVPMDAWEAEKAEQDAVDLLSGRKAAPDPGFEPEDGTDYCDNCGTHDPEELPVYGTTWVEGEGWVRAVVGTTMLCSGCATLVGRRVV